MKTVATAVFQDFAYMVSSTVNYNKYPTFSIHRKFHGDNWWIGLILFQHKETSKKVFVKKVESSISQHPP